MMHFFILVISLFTFWMLLSGFWDNTLLLVFGVLSSVFAAFIGLRIKWQNEFKLDLAFFRRFPKYVGWLVYQIYLANIDTAKRILFPKKYPISPTIRMLSMSQSTQFGQTIYANSITITPGTVSIDIENDQVIVHALAEGSIDELELGEMDSRVSALESKK